MEKKYIGYDYRDVTVSRKLESIWKDGYSSFGWKVEKSQPAIEKHVRGPLRVMAAPLALLPGRFFKDMVQDHESEDKVELKLKRDKQIRNRNELNRLQVTMEETLSEMEHMEATKTLGASVGAYVAGLLGTVCMGFAVFGYLGANMMACVGFAVPGFAGWIMAFVLYYLLKGRKEKSVAQAMEQKYEEVNNVFRQAYELSEINDFETVVS